MILRLVTLLAGVLIATVSNAADYYFDRVNVISMESERVRQDQRVVIRDGRISAMGSVTEVGVPEGATRIDGVGAYLMPGLAEMHAHVPVPVPGETGNEQQTRDVLMLYLANGITTIRGMLGDPAHLTLRDGLAKGSWVGPRLYTSGPSFSARSVTSPAQAAQMVREQVDSGYDFLKLHPGLTRDEYLAITAAATELGIGFAGHVSTDVGLALTLQAGQASIDHLDGYAQEFVPLGHALHGTAPDFFGVNLTSGMSVKGVDDLARRTREANVWNVPTQSLLENILYAQSMPALMARPEMEYVRAATRDDWSERVAKFRSAMTPEAAEHYLNVRRELITHLQKHGAGLLLGSDAPQMMNVPGFSLHEELGYLVNAGLTPYQALASGTVNVARFLGEDDSGAVVLGYRANLVLLDANPLSDISNTRLVRGVMLEGRWFGRAELDAALRAIRARKI